MRPSSVPPPGSLIHVRRRPSAPGATPRSGPGPPPEADLATLPGRHPRPAGTHRSGHRPVLGLLAAGREELGRPVQPRRRHGPPGAAASRTPAATGSGPLLLLEAAPRRPATT